MIKSRSLLLMLVCALSNAMDNKNAGDYNLQTIRIEPSMTGWSLISSSENFLDYDPSTCLVSNGKESAWVRRYHDAKQNKYYYASLKRGDDGMYLVADNEGKMYMKLVFEPMHLALNKNGTILLVEGPFSILSENGLIRSTNNALIACILNTKKMYTLANYTAPGGHTTSCIGFKKNADHDIAVADFRLTHQEWNLSVIEQ